MDVPETSATEAAPAATPAGVKAPPTLTQEQVNSIVQSRLEAARAQWEKDATPKTDPSVEQKIAELEARSEKAEAAAVAAIVARAAAGAHNPETVAKLVDLDGLGSGDAAAISQKVAEYLDANPYLVKQPAAPDTTPSPGVTTGGGPKLLTADQIAAMSPEDIAANQETYDLVVASYAALTK